MSQHISSYSTYTPSKRKSCGSAGAFVGISIRYSPHRWMDSAVRFTWTLCSAPSTTCCRLAALRDCSSRAHYYLDICSNDISSELSLPAQQLYLSSPSFSACLQRIPLGTHLELHVPHNHRPLHNSQCTRRFRYKLSFAIGVHGVAPLTLTQKSTKFQCTSQSGQLYAMKYCQ